MAETVVMPKLGLLMETGVVGAWRVAEGDEVSVGQVIAEITTEKITYELESQAAGVLLKILPEEVEAPVGSPSESSGSRESKPRVWKKGWRRCGRGPGWPGEDRPPRVRKKRACFVRPGPRRTREWLGLCSSGGRPRWPRRRPAQESALDGIEVLDITARAFLGELKCAALGAFPGMSEKRLNKKLQSPAQRRLASGGSRTRRRHGGWPSPHDPGSDRRGHELHLGRGGGARSLRACS